MMHLSKFVTKFVKDDVVCYYHSLKNLPIYYSQEQSSLIDTCLDKQISILDTNIITDLIENGFIVKDEKDDIVLFQQYRDSLPKPGITVAYFILSEDCNFACTYCFLGNGDKKCSYGQKNMTYETAQKCIDDFFYQTQLSGIGDETVREIIFYGGEPLLAFSTLKYTVERIEQLSKTGKIPFSVQFSIVTNGSLITDEIAAFFAKHNISVSLSLDGPTKDANKHRVLKNKTCAYETIISAIAKLQAAAVSFGVSLTLSNESLSVPVSELIAFLKLNRIESLCMNTMMYPKQNNQGNDYYEKAVHYIIEFWKRAKKEGILEERIIRKLRAFVKQEFYYSDCAATGGSQLVFTPDGAIGICHGELESKNNYIFSLSEKTNINSHPLLKKWTFNSPIMRDECRECYAIGVCGGGCPLNADKNEKHIDEGFCVHTKRILEYMIWDLYDHMMEENDVASN